MTRFGTMDSYSAFLYNDPPIVSHKYFLFFGNILPYKGIDVFIDACQKVQDKLNEFHFVIAGAGYDESINKIKNNDHFTLINTYLTNRDLANLIRNCYAVVCPHKTASQSGIPQTTFAFNKPIIVSRIESFEDIVVDKFNGVVFDKYSSESLALSIEELATDVTLYNKIVFNIKQFTRFMPQYDWNNIERGYIEYMNKNTNR